MTNPFDRPATIDRTIHPTTGGGGGGVIPSEGVVMRIEEVEEYLRTTPSGQWERLKWKCTALLGGELVPYEWDSGRAWSDGDDKYSTGDLLVIARALAGNPKLTSRDLSDDFDAWYIALDVPDRPDEKRIIHVLPKLKGSYTRGKFIDKTSIRPASDAERAAFAAAEGRAAQHPPGDPTPAPEPPRAAPTPAEQIDADGEGATPISSGVATRYGGSAPSPSAPPEVKAALDEAPWVPPTPMVQPPDDDDAPQIQESKKRRKGGGRKRRTKAFTARVEAAKARIPTTYPERSGVPALLAWLIDAAADAELAGVPLPWPANRWIREHLPLIHNKAWTTYFPGAADLPVTVERLREVLWVDEHGGALRLYR